MEGCLQLTRTTDGRYILSAAITLIERHALLSTGVAVLISPKRGEYVSGEVPLLLITPEVLGKSSGQKDRTQYLRWHLGESGTQLGSDVLKIFAEVVATVFAGMVPKACPVPTQTN